MASIGKLLSPVGTACPGIAWAKDFGLPCPGQLIIENSTSLITFVAVNFNSRGKVGLFCGGGDTYTTAIADGQVYVNVWAARRAGVWSSSVTLTIYLGYGFVATDTIYAYPSSNFSGAVSKSVSTDSTLCGTVVKATVTVNDNGTFSIA